MKKTLIISLTLLMGFAALGAAEDMSWSGKEHSVYAHIGQVSGCLVGSAVWHPDSSRLDLVAYSKLNNQRASTPVCCESPEIHIYADVGHWRLKNQASVWIWCSHCKAYDHLDGMIISEKWVNCADIALNDLTSPPIILEERKAIVDRHFDSIMGQSK